MSADDNETDIVDVVAQSRKKRAAGYVAILEKYSKPGDFKRRTSREGSSKSGGSGGDDNEGGGASSSAREQSSKARGSKRSSSFSAIASPQQPSMPALTPFYRALHGDISDDEFENFSLSGTASTPLVSHSHSKRRRGDSKFFHSAASDIHASASASGHSSSHSEFSSRKKAKHSSSRKKRGKKRRWDEEEASGSMEDWALRLDAETGYLSHILGSDRSFAKELRAACRAVKPNKSLRRKLGWTKHVMRTLRDEAKERRRDEKALRERAAANAAAGANGGSGANGGGVKRESPGAAAMASESSPSESRPSTPSQFVSLSSISDHSSKFGMSLARDPALKGEPGVKGEIKGGAPSDNPANALAHVLLTTYKTCNRVGLYYDEEALSALGSCSDGSVVSPELGNSVVAVGSLRPKRAHGLGYASSAIGRPPANLATPPPGGKGGGLGKAATRVPVVGRPMRRLSVVGLPIRTRRFIPPATRGPYQTKALTALGKKPDYEEFRKQRARELGITDPAIIAGLYPKGHGPRTRLPVSTSSLPPLPPLHAGAGNSASSSLPPLPKPYHAPAASGSRLTAGLFTSGLSRSNSGSSSSSSGRSNFMKRFGSGSASTTLPSLPPRTSSAFIGNPYHGGGSTLSTGSVSSPSTHYNSNSTHSIGSANAPSNSTTLRSRAAALVGVLNKPSPIANIGSSSATRSVVGLTSAPPSFNDMSHNNSSSSSAPAPPPPPSGFPPASLPTSGAYSIEHVGLPASATGGIGSTQPPPIIGIPRVPTSSSAAVASSPHGGGGLLPAATIMGRVAAPPIVGVGGPPPPNTAGAANAAGVAPLHRVVGRTCAQQNKLPSNGVNVRTTYVGSTSYHNKPPR